MQQKLIAVLLIPTIAALLLGALRLQAALSSAGSYGRVETFATAARDSTALIHQLQMERDLTAGFRPGDRNLRSLGHDPSTVDRAAAQVRRTLTEVESVESVESAESTAGADLRNKIRTALGGLDRLSSVRRSATSAQAPPAAVFRDYTAIIASLLAVVGETGAHSDAGKVAGQLFALESLATAKESASRLRATLYRALVEGRLDRTAYPELVAAQAQQASSTATYLSHASAAQQERYRSVAAGAGQDRIEQIVKEALAGHSPKTWGVSPVDWFQLASGQLDELRRIESAHTGDIAATLGDLASAARNGALVSVLLICLILGFAGFAAVVVGRWTSRPLRMLRSAALGVAHRDLPETVRRLQSGPQPELDLSVQPIPIHAQDEIGEVARAFDAVHEQAVRLASEHALLRNSVNGMFVNLARRSQTLVERQLRLIDDLESGEQDPDRLANLFQLDHLATRMRRNDENLLVLAGAPAGRRRSEPVPLVDVIRAASAEVEQYSRVQIDIQPGHEVISPAVNDTVHLIAELLENATAFSPPHTAVQVRALGLGAKGEVVVEIDDEGIGMSPEELAKANEKLASPDAAMSSVMESPMESPMMGLYVVARLARRQGIHVQLRASQYGGVTALVRLPAAIIRRAGAEPEPGPPRHRLIPEQPSGPLPAPEPNGTGAAAPAVKDPAAVDGGDLLTGLPDPLGDLPPAPASDDPERSPIFDALQSEWFRPVVPVPPSRRPDPADTGVPAGWPRVASPPASAGDAGDADRPDVFVPDAEPVTALPPDAGQLDREPLASGSAPAAQWNSPADEGWRAVAALSTQPASGFTSAGLPLRVPGQNLVPGSAATSSTPSSGPPRVQPHRDPEEARGLSAYQQGIGRARAAAEQAGAQHPDRPAPEAPEEPS